jgi:hypothetical protein
MGIISEQIALNHTDLRLRARYPARSHPLSKDYPMRTYPTNTPSFHISFPFPTGAHTSEFTIGKVYISVISDSDGVSVTARIIILVPEPALNQFTFVYWHCFQRISLPT